jgi:phosphosulfolactate phosphohydrolase-like enzyme
VDTIPAAHRQAKYQVRFDWAADGAAAVAADADVVVWVDALRGDDAQESRPALPGDGAVLAAGLTDASAVARWILDEQVRLGRRAMVALVAAGGLTPGGSPRFAVEDLLAAGAVVDALAAVGIDYSSPEAAAACAAFTGLRGAVAHLLTASVSGQEQVAAGTPLAEIAAAGRLGTSDAVTVLRASRQTPAAPSE